MKKNKDILIYTISLLVYYFILQSVNMGKYSSISFLQDNSAYDFEHTKIIVKNVILLSTVNLFGLNYIFNKINDVINLRNLIIIRNKNNSFFIFSIIKSAIKIVLVKLIIDLFITKLNYIWLVVIVNMSIFLTMLIYSFLYYIFSGVVKLKNAWLYLILLNVISFLLYERMMGVSVFVFVPYKLYIDTTYLIIGKLFICILLTMYIFINRKEVID